MLNVPFPAGIKDFMCELCGKTFSERNTMETHKLIHTGELGVPGDRPAGCRGLCWGHLHLVQGVESLAVRLYVDFFRISGTIVP